MTADRPLSVGIQRLWDGLSDPGAEAYELLDLATTARRASVPTSPEWAGARLGEGLARIYVARQMAEWGNRSYAIQAAEAAMDALRDAVAHLPGSYDPTPSEVAAARAVLMREWRTAQSEAGLERLASLSIAALRTPQL